MTFSTLLEILALIAFIIAAIGITYRKSDIIGAGLALWSLSELVTRLTSITLSTILLLLAFIAFVGAAIGWRYRKLSLVAIGLALWMLSLVIGPVFHIS